MRKLDSKFHIENDQIVKTSNGDVIPEDEPVFLLRARDYLALPMLEYYRKLSVEDGCTDYHLNGLLDMHGRFVRFQTENPGKMKQPGITRGL